MSSTSIIKLQKRIKQIEKEKRQLEIKLSRLQYDQITNFYLDSKSSYQQLKRYSMNYNIVP
jgi:hypothetical protein